MIEDFINSNNKQTKFIFFSGKGGVGKSTVSCATALWLALKGYKILLVTTDPAPNLSDIFGKEIGHKITPINGVENLSAIEINPDIAAREYREGVLAPLRVLLDEKNIQVMDDQLKSPCVEEVAAFNKFIQFMDDPNFDVVLFDTAPTGHTIRLLELPSGWVETLENNSATCIGPGASLQSSKQKYEKAISYLQNPARTLFVFVLKPENSSVLETKRSTSELSGLGVETGLLVINGLLPEKYCTDEFFRKRKSEEQKAIGKIESEFAKIKKIYMPMRQREVGGIGSLESFAGTLFDNVDDTQVNLTEPINAPHTADLSFNTDEAIKRLMPSKTTRYLFFTGKGGVGKSTVACTTSLYLADSGLKTLIVTTDPASHLHDILGQKVGSEPTPISGVNGLFAARIDQRKALEEYKNRIMAAVKDLDEGTQKSVEEDLNSPCAEEMAAFEKFMSYFEPGDFDIVAFDTAPTGHTIRLLELPVDWKGFIDLGTLTHQTSDNTRQKYSDVIEIMRSSERSTFIFVVYPEYTPIIEAWRASEDLKAQVGIETGLVAVNYLLPENYGKNSFFESRRRQQEKYLNEIKHRFHVPAFGIPLLNSEPRGIAMLRELGMTIFGAVREDELWHSKTKS